ncbi:endonuclease domain-containing protein [Sphingomonas sp.]|uniref:endonuclease domain-containing protein n=1 Tax=Sphingomonas sp. TaxID=28214 RepID=UPI00286BC34E|nr:endonuclease domain-containing protein [Sphingomonas sp.]
MTWPEIILWRRLRQRPGGLKFRRQHPAGNYVLDFFCSDARLAIEVDGIGHDMGARPARDQARDRWLKDQGVDTIRIAAGDITRSPDSIVDSIVNACLDRRKPLHQLAAGPPPRAGEETI